NPENGGFVASKAIVAPDVELVGRCFADAAQEISFGPYSLLTDSNHRPAQLPETLGGTWIIYLRAGDTVLSRPRIVNAGGEPVRATTDLGRAMALPPGKALNVELHRILSGEGEGADALVAELLDLVASLRGLPPATFQVFKVLCDHPAVLTHMAFHASPAQRDAVLALHDALPFAWYMLPRAHWQAAENASGWRAMKLLEGLDDAPRYAQEMVETMRREIISRQPLLEAVLAPAASSLDLTTTTQNFMRRARDRIRDSSRHRYRRRLGDALPAYFMSFDGRVLDTLDAPCAAAFAALGRWMPEPDDIRHIKMTARNHPQWFAEAFAITFRDHS
ncbi:MAG: hypothetical protein AB7U34_02505, partial [Novosphingobium sp.]